MGFSPGILYPCLVDGRANEFGAALDYAQCRMRETALDSVQSVFLNELLDYADRKFPVGNNAIQPGRILESPEHLQRMAARGVPCVEIQSASAISLDFRLIRVEAPMGKVVFSCDWSYVCARFAAGEGDMDGESPHNRGRRCRQRGG